MSDERCEPPEELRGVERIHWLENVAGGAPGIVLWEKLPFDDEWGWSLYGGGWHSPETAYQSGFRYFMLIPKPADLAAAKEREAGLVGENAKLRELAGRVCNAWDAIGGALETSSDVDDFNECEQATFELRSMLDGETP